jgi:nucleotide-binding universal stress UspA family protein
MTMSMFSTPVVVGVDSAGASRAALVAAAELCRLSGADLHLVHVRTASPLLHGQPMTPRQRERSDDEARALLEHEAEVARSLGVEPAGTHLRFGNRIDHAVALVQEELGAGLLVVGAPTTGAVTRWFSSNTGTVRRSPASVLVVRQHTVATGDGPADGVAASAGGELERESEVVEHRG